MPRTVVPVGTRVLTARNVGAPTRGFERDGRGHSESSFIVGKNKYTIAGWLYSRWAGGGNFDVTDLPLLVTLGGGNNGIRLSRTTSGSTVVLRITIRDSQASGTGKVYTINVSNDHVFKPGVIKDKWTLWTAKVGPDEFQTFRVFDTNGDVMIDNEGFLFDGTGALDHFTAVTVGHETGVIVNRSFPGDIGEIAVFDDFVSDADLAEMAINGIKHIDAVGGWTWQDEDGGNYGVAPALAGATKLTNTAPSRVLLSRAVAAGRTLV